MGFRILPVIFMLSLCSLSAQEFGIATYYSDDFHGRKTAYGVRYDKNELTAAHKKHPFGTMLRVTNMDNNKSVVVKVNDRGPYISGRIIELSKAAAQRLNMLDKGLAEVKLEVVKRPAPGTEEPVRENEAKGSATSSPENYGDRSGSSSSSSSGETSSGNSSSANNPDRQRQTTEDRQSTSSSSKPASSQRSPSQTGNRGNTQTEKKEPVARLVRGKFNKYGLYKIQLEQGPASGFGVQVAYLSNFENVMTKIAELQGMWFDDILVSMEPGPGGSTGYKIILGMYDTEAKAQHYKGDLKKKHGIDGFVVSFSAIRP
ncbi:MAG: septal ring lytic transglycosylase RlpA family protein [Saprospiraceae bacterium]|nr:septal ring lytic transglycosylase RlpA family protein [Saprospiraceae bacterium]